MHKKLMAVAVAGALAAPGVALAQTSTVQIGGSITVFYYIHDANNPAVSKNGDILEASEPELFVRGEEKLGGDLSAWFQCTSSLDAIITGAANALGWCGRNSGLGFKGSWGNIFAGNWDTPHKLVFNRIRGAFGGTNPMTGGSAIILQGGSASGTQNPLQNAAPGASAVAGTTVITRAATLAGVTTGTVAVTVGQPAGAGTTTITNNPERFFRRQASTWTYHSPVWAGFQLQGAFSAANETTGIPAANPLKPRLYSIAAHYDNGPLYLGVGYERHKDYNPGNTTVGFTASSYAGGDDHNWLLGAGYTFFGRLKLTGLYSRSHYDVTNAGHAKVTGFVFFADWAVAGPHVVRAAFGKVRDISGTTSQNFGTYRGPTGAGCGATSTVSCMGDTGAKWWNIHYEYQFSKRTAALINYNKIDNDSKGAFSLGKVNAVAGASQTSFGLGMKHRF